MQWMRTITAAAALMLVGAAPAGEHWTRAWTASMWQAAGKDVVTIENATIRAQVRVGAGGSKIRLRLANDYGPAFQIGAATVRVAGGLPVRVTFGGKDAALMPEGAPLISDPIDMPVEPFE